MCGIAITSRQAHADHIVPFSRGGETTLINAQALCISCNLRKSDSMTFSIQKQSFAGWQNRLPAGFKPRGWQADATNRFHEYIEQGDYSLSFTAKVDPGFGKTIFAALVGLTMRDARLTDWLVVLVPNLNLVNQTIEDAPLTGMQLTAGSLGQDRSVLRAQGYHGEVLTYQMLMANQAAYQRQAARYGKRWVVVKDEAHRLADPEDREEAAAWTVAIDDCLMPYVPYRVTMTGTLFRSDEYAIKDIPYGAADEKGARQAMPHYSTTMAEGIANCWVRRLVFQTQQGRVEWIERKDETIQERAVDLSDDTLKKKDRSAALNTALAIDLPFAQELLRMGYEELKRRRRHVADAAMIVICKDKHHARETREWIKANLRVDAPLVLGEDRTSGQAIEDFKKESPGNHEIIVAVKMISEGCSIKRLQVGVLLTNIVTRLNFLQTGARCNRNRSGEHETATWFIPALPEFVTYALEYEQEILHVINERDEDGRDAIGGGPRPLCAICEDQESPSFTGICPGPGSDPCPLTARRQVYRVGSEATQLEIIAGGDNYAHELWQQAAALAAKENTEAELVARILRSAGLTPKPKEQGDAPRSLVSQLDEQRDRYNRFTDAVCRVIKGNGCELPVGEIKRQINRTALVEGHARNDTTDLGAMTRKAEWASNVSAVVDQVEEAIRVEGAKR